MGALARTPISKRVRFFVLQRDRFTCQYCGDRGPDVILEVDHIHPVAAGGLNLLENLATACLRCNRGKAGKPLLSIPEGGQWVRDDEGLVEPYVLTVEQERICEAVADAESRAFDRWLADLDSETAAEASIEFCSEVEELA